MSLLKALNHLYIVFYCVRRPLPYCFTSLCFRLPAVTVDLCNLNHLKCFNRLKNRSHTSFFCIYIADEGRINVFYILSTEMSFLHDSAYDIWTRFRRLTVRKVSYLDFKFVLIDDLQEIMKSMCRNACIYLFIE